MNSFYKMLEKDTTYKNLREALESRQSPQLLTGVSAVHKAYIIYSLYKSTGKQALVIMPDENSASKLVEDINSFLSDERAYLFPVRDMLFTHMEGASYEYEHMRLGVLDRILTDRAPIVVASAQAALMHTIPPEDFISNSYTISAGESYHLDDLLGKLVAAGYQRSDQVDGISQFAARGGILDVFSPGEEQPFRLEFWGDEVDTIATFDVATQRRLENTDKIEIAPVKESLIRDSLAFAKQLGEIYDSLKGKQGALAKENIEKDIIKLENNQPLTSSDKYMPLLYGKATTLFDYCDDRLVFLSDSANVKESIENVQAQQNEDIKIMLEEGILFSGCDKFSEDYPYAIDIFHKAPTTILDTFTRSMPDFKLAGIQSLNVVQLSPWSGDIELLLEDLDDYLREGCGVVIMAGTEKAAATLFEDLLATDIPVELGGTFNDVPKGKVVVVPGGLSAGMKFREIGLVIITHLKTKAAAPKRKRRFSSGKKIRQISDLTIGSHVVHAAHGIGVFGGIVKRDIHGVTKDFIKIKYAGTDTLFVPVTQLDMVSRYVGAGDNAKVRLNRLNSLEWQKTRSRVKGVVKEMAEELTQLYAKRMNTKGYAFSQDTEWQQNFESRFPYEETDDQLRTAYEIKKDMERPIPMDRLLCGDVGFGKTEVALRGIFKCVMDSKQCAVLVPTTILAWQHYQTFTQRLENFPIKVELLSRFRTPKQQKEIIKKLKTGEIDVVIGTHRVIQKDIVFKDLGLCVIDEEQRFGVAHKERFKELRASVDVLTLSATPIPRTLNMALSGIRDMSVIEEPPQDRHPVQTYVMEHEDGVIHQALQRELRRGGQVFYLHNNISTINRCALKLQEALPEARIEVAHGRMGEERLSDIWRRLMEQELDILVCTTIIETGVDVPNANTLIIEDADRYGLSQLYQLRGRVGRSTRRAYAYLTFRKGKALSEIAAKRLSAIREFTTFGSGFQIAMRDLEIRGSGSLLGAQQHGHMDAVGYDMYIKLLEEAVREQTGQPPELKVECTIDIRLDAYIPEDYISNTNQRIDVYKRISSIESTEDSMDVVDELIDRFGDPPKSVIGLIDVALVRGTAARIGITDIQQTHNKILFYPQELNMELTSKIVGEMGRRVLVNAGERPYYSVNIDKDSTPLETIQETLEIMGGVLS